MDTMGEPVTIGDLKVSTGDYVVADRDGVVVVPAAIAGEVASKVAGIIGTENELRKMVLSGMDPQEAYRKYRMF